MRTLKKKMIFPVCAFGVLFCWAGIARAEEKPAEPPKITDAQKAVAWKAQALFLPAQQEFALRKNELESIVIQLQRFCGEKAQLVWTAEDISCAPKPETAKPEAVKPDKK